MSEAVITFVSHEMHDAVVVVYTKVVRVEYEGTVDNFMAALDAAPAVRVVSMEALSA